MLVLGPVGPVGPDSERLVYRSAYVFRVPTVSYSSYNLHVRRKVGFFVIFMILLILSILRSWVIFKIRGRQAPVATFLCFFLYFSHALLIFAVCVLSTLFTCHDYHASVPDMFFPFSFSVRAHRVINGTPTRGLDWCIDHLLDARLAPRCNARLRSSIARYCNV